MFLFVLMCFRKMEVYCEQIVELVVFEFEYVQVLYVMMFVYKNKGLEFESFEEILDFNLENEDFMFFVGNF